MSLILDALKKLDREKAAKSGGNGDITAEILKAGDTPRRGGILPLLFTLAITASVAVVITYMAVSGSHPRTGDTLTTAPAAPAPNPTVPKGIAERGSISTEASQAPHSAVTGAVRPDKAKKAHEVTAKGHPSVGAVTPTKRTARPEQGSVNPPVLKVSGIIWQDVPSERKAVINGTVTREGDSVEGVKVLEIYPTYVVVSSKGKSFKVKMFD